MNILLWVVQLTLAVLCFSGGAYKIFMFDELAKMPATGALSRDVWASLGVFEILCGLLLIVPAAAKWMPVLTPLAAAALAVEGLALAAIDCYQSPGLGRRDRGDGGGGGLRAVHTQLAGLTCGYLRS
jgi:DoxX-like family